jgi:hypothetical protein
MDVAPQNGAHVLVLIDHIEELVGVLESDLVEPAAAHRHGVMMEADQGVFGVSGAECRVECGQRLLAEPALRGVRHGAVEQHHAPGAHVDVAVGDEGLATQLATHGLRLVVIARQTENGEIQRAEDALDVLVAADIVLHEIAGDEDCIHRPVARLRNAQSPRQSRQRSDAAQRFGLAAVQMRIGELDQSQYAHDANVKPKLRLKTRAATCEFLGRPRRRQCSRSVMGL